MCVWDGTYTAPEAEREAMDQVPGWADDEVLPGDRRDRRIGESRRSINRTTAQLKAA
jgi:hypothetical protein